MKKTVLVVEDDPDIQDYYALILPEIGDLEILRSYNGQEALQIIDSQKKIDFIILDLIMPVMNGIEFMKILRQERKSTIPVIVSTVDEVTVANFQRVDGAQGYFFKLDNVENLLEMLRKYCA